MILKITRIERIETNSVVFLTLALTPCLPLQIDKIAAQTTDELTGFANDWQF